MEATRGETESALKRIGGIIDKSDHRNFKIVVDGHTVTKVSISHSWRKLGDYELGLIAKQAKLSKRELFDIIKQKNGLDWYREHLRLKGYLPQN